MSIVRVLYRLRLRAADLDALRSAWADVVAAHRDAGHGALESLFLANRDVAAAELPDQEIIEVLAISRWESFEAWQEQRRDDVDPEAYARFRTLCEVESKTVMDELASLQRGKDSLTALQDFFAVDESTALELLTLSQWADAEFAIALHGYPRDNLIPPPMSLRLQNPEYRRLLREAAADQAPELLDVLL